MHLQVVLAIRQYKKSKPISQCAILAKSCRNAWWDCCVYFRVIATGQHSFFWINVAVVASHDQNVSDLTSSAGPAPRGAFRGCAPPNHCLCPTKWELCPPPSKDCPPTKVTSLMPLKCNSRPETLKMLIITLEFVSKNCFFRRFCN